MSEWTCRVSGGAFGFVGSIEACGPWEVAPGTSDYAGCEGLNVTVGGWPGTGQGRGATVMEGGQAERGAGREGVKSAKRAFGAFCTSVRALTAWTWPRWVGEG